jgi:hypothetical protein
MKHCIFRYETALRLGVAFDRGRKNQSDAVHGIGLCAVAIILGTSSREEFRTVIRSLWTKHLSSIEINHKLMEVCDDGVMGMQQVSNWRREFGNGSWAIRHDGDCSSKHSRPKTDVNRAEWRNGFRKRCVQHVEGRRLHSNEEVHMALREWLWKQELEFYSDE